MKKQPSGHILVEKLCRLLGVNLPQYRILLKLFSVLGDRLEFMGISAGLKHILGFYLFGSLLLCLFSLVASLSAYLSIMTALSMYLIFWMLLMDAGNSIMNPDEASVLAHQPIGGATYVSAKLTHVFVTVGAIVPTLNFFPAIAGLHIRDSRWFYPLTHLISVYLAGVFIAFFVCGLYGWLFRFVSPSKLKNASLWLQLIAFLLMPIMQPVAIAAANSGLPSTAAILGSSWMPWSWFVAVGLLGHPGNSDFSGWQAGLACLITAAFIAFGLRAFSMDYMARVSSLLQGSAGPTKDHKRVSWLYPILKRFTGGPSGYGSFSFMSIMFRRDWNFLRQGLMGALPLLVMLLLPAIQGIRKSPFSTGKLAITDFSLMHLFPHCIGMALMVACILIPYTAEPKGSAIFIGLPLRPSRAFVRGIYASLWVPLIFLHLFLMVLCMWFWGVVPALLFISFSMVLVSLYIGLTIFLIDGFPFANPFKPSAIAAMPMFFLIGGIAALFVSAIQWVVFHNVYAVLALVVLIGILAGGVGHLSLKKLGGKIQTNLTILGFGPSRMFQEVE